MKVNGFRILLIGYFAFFLTGWRGVLATNAPETPPYITSEATVMPETQPTTSASRQEDDMPKDPPFPIPGGPGSQALIEKAKADLARRLSVPASDIILLEAASVIWPDASLGCPQEGMMYAQVLTPGYVIRLKFGEQEFEYHAGKGTTVIYCENPTPPMPGEPGNT